MRLTSAAALEFRPRRSAPRSSQLSHASARITLFSALEGALLDARTLDAGNNRPMLRLLSEAGVGVVFFTAMTLEEVAPVAIELGIPRLIIEAGGAIARRNGNDWHVEPCGPSSEALLDVVRTIEEISTAALLVYSALPESQAARLSGRSGEMLWHSMQRSYSEPFVLESGTIESVRAAAASIGLSVRRGGPLYYLSPDRGAAFARLREEMPSDVTIAIGASPLDAEVMARADVAVALRRADGSPDPELLEQVPTARLSSESAPDGWAAALREVLSAARTTGRQREESALS